MNKIIILLIIIVFSINWQRCSPKYNKYNFSINSLSDGTSKPFFDSIIAHIYENYSFKDTISGYVIYKETLNEVMVFEGGETRIESWSSKKSNELVEFSKFDLFSGGTERLYLLQFFTGRPPTPNLTKYFVFLSLGFDDKDNLTRIGKSFLGLIKYVDVGGQTKETIKFNHTIKIKFKNELIFSEVKRFNSKNEALSFIFENRGNNRLYSTDDKYILTKILIKNSVFNSGNPFLIKTNTVFPDDKIEFTNNNLSDTFNYINLN